MFGTLQDRLTKELALAGIDDMAAANAWIRVDFLPRHNARFKTKPALPDSAFASVEANRVVVTLPPTLRDLPASKIATAAIVHAEIIMPLVSEDALDRVRSVAPGWDRQYLAATYLAWMKGKERPRQAACGGHTTRSLHHY